MTITGGTALGKDEIDRMMKDAEAHAEEDKQRREEAEIRNNADSLVFQTEKLLQGAGRQGLAPTRRTKIEATLKALKDALAGTDIEAVKRGARGADLREPGVRAAAVPGRGRAAGGGGRRRRWAGCGLRPVRRRGGRRRDRRGRRAEGRLSRCRPTTTAPTRPAGDDAVEPEVDSGETDVEAASRGGRARPRGTARRERDELPRHAPAHAGRLRELPQARDREQTALVERATEGLVEQLLPVLDSFELAVASVPGDERRRREACARASSSLTPSSARRAREGRAGAHRRRRASRSTRTSTKP